MTAPPLPDPTEPAPESVLPHRAPMLLVEGVLERGAGLVVCRCRVGRDTPLAGEHGISSLLALEMGAQASALLEVTATGEGAVRSGYLVSIRRACLHQATLPVGVPLRVEARLSGGAGGLQLVHIRVSTEDASDRTIAEADLGTYVASGPAPAAPGEPPAPPAAG
jgi:predicted hotdog family 3-hydroxylacyl-ACP dehydratase